MQPLSTYDSESEESEEELVKRSDVDNDDDDDDATIKLFHKNKNKSKNKKSELPDNKIELVSPSDEEFSLKVFTNPFISSVSATAATTNTNTNTNTNINSGSSSTNSLSTPSGAFSFSILSPRPNLSSSSSSSSLSSSSLVELLKSDDPDSISFWETWRVRILFVLFAQLISLVQASQNILRVELIKHQWDAPTLMNSTVYLLLWICTSIYLKDFSSAKDKAYILAAIADVEGNSLVLLAYQYTSITSTTLLDFFNLPVVMCLGYFVFGRKTYFKQVAAIGMAMLGLSLLIESDSQTDADDGHGKKPVLGDIMMLTGAGLIGISNVLEEYCVKQDSNIVKFLHNIGAYGFLLSIIQGVILEWNVVAKAQMTWMAWLYYIGYICATLCYYTLVPIFLTYSNATLMNLSLLTSDLYAMSAGLFLFHIRLHPLYFISFFMVISGVITYNIFERQTQEQEEIYERQQENRRAQLGDISLETITVDSSNHHKSSSTTKNHNSNKHTSTENHTDDNTDDHASSAQSKEAIEIMDDVIDDENMALIKTNYTNGHHIRHQDSLDLNITGANRKQSQTSSQQSKQPSKQQQQQQQQNGKDIKTEKKNGFSDTFQSRTQVVKLKPPRKMPLHQLSPGNLTDKFRNAFTSDSSDEIEKPTSKLRNSSTPTSNSNFDPTSHLHHNHNISQQDILQNIAVL